MSIRTLNNAIAATWLATLAIAMGSAAARSADAIATVNLSLDGAKRAATAALEYARAHAAPGAAIAVVDAGGHTMLVVRLDGTFPAGADISIGKARTAVMFKRPTHALEDIINKGRDAMIPVAAVTWFTPLQGGIPLLIDGQVAGGIGVSGAASAQQDEEIAMAGAQALTVPAPIATVEHIAAADVNAGFGKGETGETLLTRPEFRVNASRRDGPGQAEVHLTDTDIFYVLEGKATVMTGGELVDPQAISPVELRGSALKGGRELRLAKGDVLTVPRGVPHWFQSVTTPFRYFVVKSIAGL